MISARSEASRVPGRGRLRTSRRRTKLPGVAPGERERRLRLAVLGALLLAALEWLSVRGHPSPEYPFVETASDSAEPQVRIPEGLLRLPIVDVHNHLLPRSPEVLERYLDELAAEAARLGVIRVLVGLNVRPLELRPPAYSRLHDDISLAAHYRYPRLYVPLLAGFDPGDPASPDYVERRLATEPWKGIGELDLRNEARHTATPANAPPLMRIYRLAARFRLPVLLHFKVGYGARASQCQAELADAFEANPDTQFIMAHQRATAGMWRFPNVTFQVEGNLGPILPEHSTRTIVGTDFQAKTMEGSGETAYAVSLLRARSALVGLSAEQAAAVAYRNADRLYGLELGAPGGLAPASPIPDRVPRR